MAWQFLTPIMYTTDQVPEHVRWIFFANPMTYVITAYRDVLYYGKIPKLETLLFAMLTGTAMLIIGWNVFQHLQKRFAEEL